MDIKYWIAEVINPIRTLENLGLLLERQDVICYPNKKQYIRITHPETIQDNIPISKMDFGSFAEYIELLKNRRYIALLFDGSFLQISIDIARNKIASHRYSYYPCPIKFKDDELLMYAEEETVANIVESFIDQEDLLLFRTPIRIDFDSEEWKEGEPHAHIHFNHTDCRCALSGAIYPSYFIKIILRYFYPNIWKRYPVLYSLSQEISGYWLRSKENQFIHFTSVKPL
jgi:hypothetical protein